MKEPETVAHKLHDNLNEAMILFLIELQFIANLFLLEVIDTDTRSYWYYPEAR